MRAGVILATILAGGVANAADKPQPLVPIDTEAKAIAVVVPKDNYLLDPVEIGTADELARSPLFGKGAVEKVQKEVDFKTEKLVVFAWAESSFGSFSGMLVAEGGKQIARFHHASSGRLAPLQRQQFQMFVVPREADISVRAGAMRADEIRGVREVSLDGMRIDFPKDPGGVANPDVITSASGLAKSPLKGAAEQIQKRVDFRKEKLVLVSWLGSSADGFWINGELSEKRVMLSFAAAGTRVDLSKHTRLFIVPKVIGVAHSGGK